MSFASQLLRIARELLAVSRAFRTNGSSQNYPDLSDDVTFSEYTGKFGLNPQAYQKIADGQDTLVALADRINALIGSEYVIEGVYFKASKSREIAIKSPERLWDFGKAWAVNASAYNLRSGLHYPKSMSRVTFRLAPVKIVDSAVIIGTAVSMKVTPFGDSQPVAPPSKPTIAVRGDELVIPVGEATVKHETDNAVRLAVGGKEFWVPKSKVRITTNEIGVPLWMARQMPGLRGYL